MKGDREPEKKLKIIKTKVFYKSKTTGKRVRETVYELANQNRLILDLNLEMLGLNYQKTDKSFFEYA